jgi:hypothetical protein
MHAISLEMVTLTPSSNVVVHVHVSGQLVKFVTKGRKHGARHHISDAILQFHFRLCLTNAFHGVYFFFFSVFLCSYIYYIYTWPLALCTFV